MPFSDTPYTPVLLSWSLDPVEVGPICQDAHHGVASVEDSSSSGRPRIVRPSEDIAPLGGIRRLGGDDGITNETSSHLRWQQALEDRRTSSGNTSRLR